MTRKYNLNEIEITKGDVETVENMAKNRKVWNLHTRMQTKQGYEYKYVVEISRGYERRFVHLETQEEFIEIQNQFEIINKVI